MAQVNKQAIAAAFGRAASHYEQHAGYSAKAPTPCWRCLVNGIMHGYWMRGAAQGA